MALHTPGRRLPGPATRPSLAHQAVNTVSSPNLHLPATAAPARKASLTALSSPLHAATPPSSMLGGDGRELELGDTVDVPGSMHGLVKFIGTVKGKKGTFAGVELSPDFASKGKNDGDVEGIRYFTTSKPGAGIFLPIHRASRRSPPSPPADAFPPTPTTPSSSNFALNGDVPDASTMPKFSQSLGPAARPPSPARNKARPSLPRPESPFKNKPNLGPTPARGSSIGSASFSKSVSGASTPRYSPSPGVGKLGGIPKGTRTPSSRPYSRTNSRVNNHTPISEDGDNTTPTPAERLSGSTDNSAPRQRSGPDDGEVKRLRDKLEERDRQLRDQAASLADMEHSLTELQGLIPPAAGPPRDLPRPSLAARSGSQGSANIDDLRAMLREKNEKIAMLTAEFDAHRADFRSTIDTLEMASTETERVYEKRIEELMEEIRGIQDRNSDVENVMLQFKQLEELVQELEEGLEDARRGEAEARSEVEFLRGEVERGRSELKREREKAATALKNANIVVDDRKRDPKEVEQRDDEIRGLKAIIHSLSSQPEAGSPRQEKPLAGRGATNPTPDPDSLANIQLVLERLERENRELQGLVERKTFNEDELEKEVVRLRGLPLDNRMSVVSDKTATQENRSSGRDSKGSWLNWRALNSAASPAFHTQGKSSQMNVSLEPMPESESVSGSSIGAGSSATLWCEICETGGHDILSCTNITNGISDGGAVKSPAAGTATATAPATAADSESARTALACPPKDSIDVPAPLAMAQKTAPPPPAGLPPPTSPPTAPLPNPFDSKPIAGKGAKDANPYEWCAICERDGHLAMSCPFEDQF